MTESTKPHGQGTLEGIRPRTYRTTTHVIYEATNGYDYWIDVRRLRSHADALRVVQWLCRQPGVELRSLDKFIQVACNAGNLRL